MGKIKERYKLSKWESICIYHGFNHSKPKADLSKMTMGQLMKFSSFRESFTLFQ